jgi:hypothetical protein
MCSSPFDGLGFVFIEELNLSYRKQASQSLLGASRLGGALPYGGERERSSENIKTMFLAPPSLSCMCH